MTRKRELRVYVSLEEAAAAVAAPRLRAQTRKAAG
jgi:hypothetical protein